MPHAFTPRAAFDQKAERVASMHRRGPRRALAANGEIYMPRWSVGPRFPLGGLVRIVLFATMMKLTAVIGLGPTTYDAAVEPLHTGTVVERGAAALLERGPVTRMVTQRVYAVRDTVRRAYPAY